MLPLAFGLGFVHGFGADHMAAVAAFLGPRPTFRQALLAGVKFGIGHSATLLLLGSLVLGARLTLTGAFEHVVNLAGGVLMILIGAGLLLRLPLHGEDRRRGHRHGHGLTLASAVLALGGVRSCLVVLPVALEGSVAVSVLAMVLFGAGVTTAMSLYGLVAAGVLWATGAGCFHGFGDGGVAKHRCRARGYSECLNEDSWRATPPQLRRCYSAVWVAAEGCTATSLEKSPSQDLVPGQSWYITK